MIAGMENPILQETEKLVGIRLIRRYAADIKVRRLQFDFEDAFKDMFPEKPKVFNWSENSPPNAPFFTFSKGTKSLGVTGTTATLALNFEEANHGEINIQNILSKYAREMDAKLTPLFSQEKFFCAIALRFTWEANTTNTDTIGAFLGRRIFGAEVNKLNIASTKATIGLEEENIYKNFEISNYVVISKRLEPKQNVFVDPHFETGDKAGVQITVDVNSKKAVRDPAINNADLHSFTHLTKYALSAIKTDFPAIFGETIKITRGLSDD